MYEEPDESPAERVLDPANRAKERADESRMHAELAAVFEGRRKFDVAIIPGLDADLARQVQKTVARLERAKAPDSPILPPASMAEAAELLKLPEARELSTCDYHIYRRPGEAMIVRWLEGEQVETFYERLQAHFDAALEGFKEDERQALGWKQDPKIAAYLKALDEIDIKMPDRYLRDLIRKHNLFVLSTQTADEINIAYLCNQLMGVSMEEVVGARSAPPEDGASDRDLAWFFKLFSLRGMDGDTEQMCFFTYLQKSDDSFE